MKSVDDSILHDEVKQFAISYACSLLGSEHSTIATFQRCISVLDYMKRTETNPQILLRIESVIKQVESAMIDNCLDAAPKYQ